MKKPERVQILRIVKDAPCEKVTADYVCSKLSEQGYDDLYGSMLMCLLILDDMIILDDERCLSLPPRRELPPWNRYSFVEGL